MVMMMMIMPPGFAKKTGSALLDRCHFEAYSQPAHMKFTWLCDDDDGGGTGDDDDDGGGDGEDGNDSTIQAARRITYKVHFASDLMVGYN